MRGFYWFDEGEIAGCSRPGIVAGGEQGRQRTQETMKALYQDLAWLHQWGIRAVLSLTEHPLPADALKQFGLEALHVPVPDLRAPTPGQMLQALNFIDWQRAQGRPVVVHCLVGQGRTGTILAAHRIRRGTSAIAAIQEVRTVCPGAIGSKVQEEALIRFATQREWII